MTLEQATLETKELEEPVSDETESVSEETEKPGGEAEEVITFKSQAELEEHTQKRIEAESNRIANLSTAPIQSENDKLKKTNTSLERRLTDRDEDNQLSRLAKAEGEEWGNTPEVREIHDVRVEVVKQGRLNRDKEIELTDTAERLDIIGRQQDAFEKALKLFLPEDTEFLSIIENFAAKLSKAESQKEMDLLYELEEKQIKAKAPTKPNRPKPDSSQPSALGGSLKDESPEARVTRGLALKAKLQD